MKLRHIICSGSVFLRHSVVLVVISALNHRCEQVVIVPCVYRIFPPSDILFSYKSQTDDTDNDEVILPNQPIDYSVAEAAAADIGNSYDSTHFTSASPNPLYHSLDYQHDLLPSFGHITFNQQMSISGSLNA